MALSRKESVQMRILNYVVTFLLTTMFLSFISCGHSQRGRLYEPNGGFSYDPPDGWEIVDSGMLKYRIAKGPVEMGFQSNINVLKEENIYSSFESYLALSLDLMSNSFPDFALLGYSATTTAQGIEGAKLTFVNTVFGFNLVQYQYYFPSDRYIFIVTCSAHISSGDKYERVFDRSVESFFIHE